MAGKPAEIGARSLALQWPFAPKQIGTNRDTELLKVIALVCMICDHAGKMFFPQYRIMRIIGRLAFPIYAYCIAVGCVYTKDFRRYLGRILLLALISQPIYAVAMAHETSAMYSISFAEQPLQAAINFYVESWHHPNVFCTLAMGIMLNWSIRNRYLVFTAALALLTWKLSKQLDYGWRGVTLIVLFYMTIARWWISLPLVGAFMLWWASIGTEYNVFGQSFGIQLFACLALPLVYVHMDTKLKLNKWVFYWMYPAHLAVILILQHIH